MKKLVLWSYVEISLGASPAPPASLSCLRDFSATFTDTFFCLQLPILKELEIYVCTWSFAVHVSSRVKSLDDFKGPVKPCYCLVQHLP